MRQSHFAVHQAERPGKRDRLDVQPSGVVGAVTLRLHWRCNARSPRLVTSPTTPDLRERPELPALCRETHRQSRRRTRPSRQTLAFRLFCQ